MCAVAIKRYISMRVAKSLVRLRLETRGYLDFLSAQPKTTWELAIIRPLRFFSGIMSEELPIPIRNLAGLLIHKFVIA